MSDGEDLKAEAEAWDYLETSRGWWDGDGAYRDCPHCGVHDRFTFLEPENGLTRKTRTGHPSARRVWQCQACRKQFSAITGTGLAGTKLPARAWFDILCLWMDMAEEEGREPTVAEIAACWPSLDGNEAHRAHWRVKNCSDTDPLLQTYRDWPRKQLSAASSGGSGDTE